MPKTFKAVSILLCFCLLFQQAGFAQVVGELDISSHLAALRNSLTPDKFRPLHLRFLSYSPIDNTFQILLDKGTASLPQTKDAPAQSRELTPTPPSAPGIEPNQPAHRLTGTPVNQLRDEAKRLLTYFLTGITLPDDTFWVNLRPDSPDNIIDHLVEQTDIGKVFLEADLQLKRDTAQFTSPQSPEGRLYWDRLYKKAEELYGTTPASIPTITRPWIVPGEIIVRETQGVSEYQSVKASGETQGLPVSQSTGSPVTGTPANRLTGTPPSAYIYKATLKVMLEEDYLKTQNGLPVSQSTGAPVTGSPAHRHTGTPAHRRTGTPANQSSNSQLYSFPDERSKALNTYSTELIKELIIPKLTKEVNTAKRYAPLRQVYYSLILAQWFKERFREQNGKPVNRSTGASVEEPTNQPAYRHTGIPVNQSTGSPAHSYISRIDSNDLTNLTSKTPWSKDNYFQAYKQSFTRGEYNIQEPVYTPSGQVIRSYMSGGLVLGQEIQAAIMNGGGPISGSSAVGPEEIFRENKAFIQAAVQGSNPADLSIEFGLDKAPEGLLNNREEPPVNPAGPTATAPTPSARKSFFKKILSSAMGLMLSFSLAVTANANMLIKVTVTVIEKNSPKKMEIIDEQPNVKMLRENAAHQDRVAFEQLLGLSLQGRKDAARAVMILLQNKALRPVFTKGNDTLKWRVYFLNSLISLLDIAGYDDCVYYFAKTFVNSISSGSIPAAEKAELLKRFKEGYKKALAAKQSDFGVDRAQVLSVVNRAIDLLGVYSVSPAADHVFKRLKLSNITAQAKQMIKGDMEALLFYLTMPEVVGPLLEAYKNINGNVDINAFVAYAFVEGFNKYAEEILYAGNIKATEKDFIFSSFRPMGLDRFGSVVKPLKDRGILREDYSSFHFFGRGVNERGDSFRNVDFDNAAAALEAHAALLIEDLIALRPEIKSAGKNPDKLSQDELRVLLYMRYCMGPVSFRKSIKSSKGVVLGNAGPYYGDGKNNGLKAAAIGLALEGTQVFRGYNNKFRIPAQKTTPRGSSPLDKINGDAQLPVAELPVVSSAIVVSRQGAYDEFAGLTAQQVGLITNPWMQNLVERNLRKVEYDESGVRKINEIEKNLAKFLTYDPSNNESVKTIIFSAVDELAPNELFKLIATFLSAKVEGFNEQFISMHTEDNGVWDGQEMLRRLFVRPNGYALRQILFSSLSALGFVITPQTAFEAVDDNFKNEIKILYAIIRGLHLLSEMPGRQLIQNEEVVYLADFIKDKMRPDKEDAERLFILAQLIMLDDAKKDKALASLPNYNKIIAMVNEDVEWGQLFTSGYQEKIDEIAQAAGSLARQIDTASSPANSSASIIAAPDKHRDLINRYEEDLHDLATVAEYLAVSGGRDAVSAEILIFIRLYQQFFWEMYRDDISQQRKDIKLLQIYRATLNKAGENKIDKLNEFLRGPITGEMTLDVISDMRAAIKGELERLSQELRGADSARSDYLDELVYFFSSEAAREELNLGEWVGQLAERYRGFYKDIDIELRSDFKSETAIIRVNKWEIKRIFDNLIKNAKSAFGKRQIDKSARKVVIQLGPNEAECKIEFRSNTGGFAEGVTADNIFTRGVGTRGSGLGMYIARRLAEEYAGDIKVREEKADNGTWVVFSVTLPAASSANFAGSPVASRSGDLGGIDMRALPQYTKIEKVGGIGNVLAPVLSSGERAFGLDQEWLELKRLVGAGITPSSDRIVSCLLSSPSLEADLGVALGVIVDIFRLQEDQVSGTEGALRKVLVLLESNKPVAELRLALSEIEVAEKEPALISQ